MVQDDFTIEETQEPNIPELVTFQMTPEQMQETIVGLYELAMEQGRLLRVVQERLDNLEAWVFMKPINRTVN